MRIISFYKHKKDKCNYSLVSLALFSDINMRETDREREQIDR